MTTKVYALEDYYIEATIQDNGDLVVEKYINLKDKNESITEIVQYDDYYVRSVNNELKYYWVNSNNDASGVVMETVLEVEKNKLFNFMNINGENLSYLETKDGGKKIYKINSTNNAIYMKYRLESIGVLNLDIGELFFRIFTEEYKNKKINNFKLRINIPSNVNELKYWGNGINNSDLHNLGLTEINATINNLVIDDNFDIRVIFDSQVISNSNNKSFRNVRDRIIRYEDYAVDKQQRELLDVYNNCSITVLNQMCGFEINRLLKNLPDSDFKQEIVNSLDSLEDSMQENSGKDIWQSVEDDRKIELTPEEKKAYLKSRLIYYVCFIVLTGYYIYIIYISKYKYRNIGKHEYLRDFPSDIRPSAVTFLVKGKINAKAVSADILDLIHRKIIIATKDVNNNKNYILEINRSINTSLLPGDSELLDLVFGSKLKTTTYELKKESLFNKNDFKMRCSNYVYSLLKRYKLLDYYDNSKKFDIKFNTSFLFAILLTISYLTTIIPSILEMKTSFHPMSIYTIYLMVMYAVFGIVIILLISKNIYRTKTGQEEYWKWMAFKRFLTHFGTMDEKKILEVFLWEKYLVYATALDCANLVEKRLNLNLFNNDLVNNAYLNIFGSDEESFNFSFVHDFDPIMNECYKQVNKKIRKEEKKIKKSNNFQ